MQINQLSIQLLADVEILIDHIVIIIILGHKDHRAQCYPDKRSKQDQ